MHQIYLTISVNANGTVLCSKPLTNFSLHRHTVRPLLKVLRHVIPGHEPQTFQLTLLRNLSQCPHRKTRRTTRGPSNVRPSHIVPRLRDMAFDRSRQAERSWWVDCVARRSLLAISSYFQSRWGIPLWIHLRRNNRISRDILPRGSSLNNAKTSVSLLQAEQKWSAKNAKSFAWIRKCLSSGSLQVPLFSREQCCAAPREQCCAAPREQCCATPSEQFVLHPVNNLCCAPWTMLCYTQWTMLCYTQ